MAKATQNTSSSSSSSNAPAKAAKAAKAPKAKAQAPAVKLGPNQVRFLAAYVAAKTPLTFKALRAATGARKGLTKAIGSATKAQPAPGTLLALGYLQVVSATVPVTLKATPAGVAALKAAQGK